MAAKDPKRRKEISALGGAAVPLEKRFLYNNRAKAAEYGKKGGISVPKYKRSFYTDRNLASVAGKKGGGKSKRKLPDAQQS